MSDHDEQPEPFACPRCGQTVEQRFWGPCAACRAQLVSAYQAQEGSGDGEAENIRYEPAMHVVPNHVATKD